MFTDKRVIHKEGLLFVETKLSPTKIIYTKHAQALDVTINL